MMEQKIVYQKQPSYDDESETSILSAEDIRARAREICSSVGHCWSNLQVLRGIEKYEAGDMKMLLQCKTPGAVESFFVEKAKNFKKGLKIERVKKYIEMTNKVEGFEKNSNDKNAIKLKPITQWMRLNSFKKLKDFQSAYDTLDNDEFKTIFDEILDFKEDNESYKKFKRFFNKFKEFKESKVHKFREHLIARKVGKEIRRLKVSLQVDYDDPFTDYKKMHAALMANKQEMEKLKEDYKKIYKGVNFIELIDYQLEYRKRSKEMMVRVRDKCLIGITDDQVLSVLTQKLTLNNTDVTPLSFLCQLMNFANVSVFAEMKSSIDDTKNLIPKSLWVTSVFESFSRPTETNGDSSNLRKVNSYSSVSTHPEVKTASGGPTLVHYAAMNPSCEILRYLLNKGLVDQAAFSLKTADGNTPLHYAAYSGILRCADFLLEQKADFTIENAQGETPLHWAATGGDLRTFNHIYRKHVNEVKCLHHEAQYGPPLLYAAKSQKFDCIGAILDKEEKADATIHDEDCDTTLHYISKDADTKWLTKVLKANALLGVKNEVGNAPIDWISKERLEKLLDSLTYKVNLKLTQDTSRKDNFEVMFQNIFGHHASGSDMKNIKAIAEAPEVQELCLHPLCQAIVSVKWQKIRKFFLLKLLFFIPFVFFLSMHPILTIQHEKLIQLNDSNGSVPQEEFDAMNNWINVSYLIWTALLTVQIFFGMISVFVLIPPFWRQSRTYVNSKKFNLRRVRRLLEFYYEELLWSDWYEYMLWVVALMYIYSDISPIVVVVVSWFSMFYVCSNHPTILPLRYMLIKILLRYIKFFIFAFGLLGGFALGFFLLANTCVVSGHSCVEDNSGFGSLYTTALKIPSMMMGEISFETFNFESSPHLQFLFGSFIFLMTCCMFNMMNGLAINITSELENKSYIFRTIAQCEMIYEFEILLKEIQAWLKWLRFPEIRTLDSLWVERIKVKPSTGECKNLEEIHGSTDHFNVEDFFETNNASKANWVWVNRGYTLSSKIIRKALDRYDVSGNVYRDPADVEIDYSQYPHDANDDASNFGNGLLSENQGLMSPFGTPAIRKEEQGHSKRGEDNLVHVVVE